MAELRISGVKLWETETGFALTSSPARAGEVPMDLSIELPDDAPDSIDGTLAEVESLELFFDAGTRVSNPGPSGIAVYAYLGRDEHFDYHLRVTELVGEQTNNVAEWMALVKALEIASRAPMLRRLEIFSDSKLVVKQARGEWRVRGHLRELHRRSVELAQALVDRGCMVTIAHVPREMNAEADRLVTDLLDASVGRKRGY